MRKTMLLPHLAWHAIALAALVCSQAQATPLSSASASIDQLRFRLIDLDPNDGIAPSISWTGGGLVGAVQALTSNDPMNANTTGLPTYQWGPAAGDQTPMGTSVQAPFPGVTVPTPSGTGGLSVSGSSIRAQVQLDSSHLHTDTYDFASTYGPIPDGSTPGNVIVGSESGHTLVTTGGADLSISPPGGAARFVLSANTLLLVDGSAQVGVSADYAWLSQYALDHPEMIYQTPDGVNHGASLIDVTANSGARLELALNAGDQSTVSPDFVMTDHVETGHLTADYFSLGTYTSAITAGSLAVMQEQYGRTETFSLALVNSGTGSLNGVLGLRVSASTMVGTNYREGTSQYFSVPEGSPIPTVPEPGTWLLSGLGLVGISLVGRRHRPTPNV
jgi:hypothetical protein